ncbi:hypothetical protein RESH_04368 [Rhodopirellula europaea SH398]|uniref:Uncharacterized protein n=1 Tax=Rhodopirellula europaea SH398 TaxID=1263868 RepID=M5S0K4_9BACT|nr:hypothetical protein RESH_04368 [Rhodopirellula europaea SH398]
MNQAVCEINESRRSQEKEVPVFPCRGWLHRWGGNHSQVVVDHPRLAANPMATDTLADGS